MKDFGKKMEILSQDKDEYGWADVNLVSPSLQLFNKTFKEGLVDVVNKEPNKRFKACSYSYLPFLKK